MGIYKGIILVLLIIILFVTFWKLFHKNPGSVTLDKISSLVNSLQSSGSEEAFVLFLFPKEIVSNGYAPGLQYSIINGKLGIDYLLNSEFNKNKASNFNSIVSELGYKPEKKEMNGVEYTRIEGGSLVECGQEILRRLYQVKDNEKIHLVIRGFDYKRDHN